MKRGNFRSEENIYLATQFAEWFGHLTGKEIGEDEASFCESLDDGTVLCRVIQRIEGSEVSKTNDPAENAFKGRENIVAFQEACHRLDLPFVLSVSHIKDKRVDAVISCLLGVAKLAAEQEGLNLPEPILETLGIGVESSAARNKHAEASSIVKKITTVFSPAKITAEMSHLAVSSAAVPVASENGEPEVTLKNLDMIVPTIPAATLERKIEVTRAVRELLSASQQDPAATVKYVVEAGLLPVLMGFLNRTVHPKLQFEATWALTNVASTHANCMVPLLRQVVQCGAVSALVPLLRSPNPDVRMQAAW